MLTILTTPRSVQAMAHAGGIPVMLFRGGTSKGAYFLASDLPTDVKQRNEVLLDLMGSPDARQIDGIGGAHPLTSKVAVVSLSPLPGVDVDYLFLQVQVDRPIVSAEQPCGNILAGIGPFAIERGLVPATTAVTTVHIRMTNTGAMVTAHVSTPNGRVMYAGDTELSGVPGRAAPVLLDFEDTAGSVCDGLLPTGAAVDVIDGVAVTCIDNGMPVVLIAADALGISGGESPAELEGNRSLCERVEQLRLAAGKLMGLGDVADKTVPKMCIVSSPSGGGTIRTRTFIPRRVHTSIGVFGAVSVATAALLTGSVAHAVQRPFDPTQPAIVRVEHPTGFFDTRVEVESDANGMRLGRSGVVSTARKLMDGTVFSKQQRSTESFPHNVGGPL